jgi:hypothetical protein
MKGTIAGRTFPIGSWSEQLIKLKSKLLTATNVNLHYGGGRNDKIFEKLLENKRHFISIYNNKNY